MFITGLQTEMENAGAQKYFYMWTFGRNEKLRKKTHNDVRVFLCNLLY